MSKRSTQWPPIYKVTQPSGLVSYQVDLRKAGGARPKFATKIEAEARAEQARVEKANGGTAIIALPQDVKLDAAKAHEILKPHKVTILEAVKYYEKHVLAYKDAPTVKEIVEKFLVEKTKKKLRPRVLQDYESRLKNIFAGDFGERRLNEISLDELKDWIRDDNWEPVTQISMQVRVSQLYNFAIKHDWIDKNLTKKIDRPKFDAAPPEIFTVEQAQALLTNSAKFNLLPYIATGFFGGVRFAEMLRLTGKSFNFETKTIFIRANVAKGRIPRTVDMLPALLAWLEPVKEYLQADKPVIDQTTFRDNKEALLEASQVKWQDNGLRHSFGSYHLAMFENAEKTSLQMGNSTAVIHRHYKALITKEVAEKFWNLRPPEAKELP